MYTWPGRPGESGDFTVIEKISRLSEIDPQEYCTRLGISSDRRFEIPSNLTDLLDRYFALSEQDQEQFLRACFWFVHAREVYSESRSATFTALISAIETLMPSAKGDDICPECKQPRRVTQRFSDFVESLASTGSVLEADRKRFYGIRSKLSHGGFLLHSDRFTWAPGLTGGKLREWEDVGTIWQLVRIVLVNWLQAQKTGT